MYHRLHGLESICVRPGNAYGEGQRPFAAQGFIATAMACALDQRPIPVFGGTGTIRDYIHVSDVASGICAALVFGKSGGCYNMGTGVGRSHGDVLSGIAALAGEIGLDIDIEVLPARAFDVPANVLDSGRLHTDTGWRVEVPFDIGFRRTWQWYQGRSCSEFPPEQSCNGCCPAANKGQHSA